MTYEYWDNGEQTIFRSPVEATWAMEVRHPDGSWVSFPDWADVVTTSQRIDSPDVVVKYSADQPRDDHGRFGSGGTSGSPVHGDAATQADAAGLTPMRDIEEAARRVAPNHQSSMAEEFRRITEGSDGWTADAPGVAEALAGMRAASEALKERDPKLAAWMQNHVVFNTMYDATNTGNVAMTGAAGGDTYAMFMNTAISPDATLDSSAALGHLTMPGKIARDVLASGQPRAEAIKALYKSVLEHEQGHVLDFAAEDAGKMMPSRWLVASIQDKFHGSEAAVKSFITSRLSEYAYQGGPKEAWGEAYAGYLAKRLDPELTGIVEQALRESRVAPKTARKVPSGMQDWLSRTPTDMVRWHFAPEKAIKYSPDQPRDDHGRFGEGTSDTATAPRTFDSESGYAWHEGDSPAREWARGLSKDDASTISSYASFGYHDVNDYLRGTYTPPKVETFVRPANERELAYLNMTAADRGQFPIEEVAPGHQMVTLGYGATKDLNGWFQPNTEDGGYLARNIYKTPQDAVYRIEPDHAREAAVREEGEKLNALIAEKGYVLPEPMVVNRAAYLPGVDVADLEAKVGEDYTEKGFSSTMTGTAGGRLDGYVAWGKFESLYNRFHDIASHQHEVGTALRMAITLPKGTKVAPVEAVRQTADERYGTKNRTEAEVLLGSGARFKIDRITYAGTRGSGDPKLNPVKFYDLHMTYVGGGSSQP